MDIRRIYREELNNRLTPKDSHLCHDSYSRISMTDKPARRSYERFVREETPESIINSLADFVLDSQKSDPAFSTIDGRTANGISKIEIGIIDSENEDEENIDLNISKKSSFKLLILNRF